MDWILNILIFAVAGWFLYSRIMPAKGIKQVTTADLKQMVKEKKKYQFVDVRTAMEFRGDSIKGFKNIPVHELKQRVQELEKDKEVVVICQSGMRSNKASKLLKKLGFTKIYNVKGGMSAWS
ncbi:MULTISPECIES: rhodanese-like domain-containing protein [Bacillaceae]|uniref:Rhodanese-like domain-containing protein n=1 Tax=Evansella alkalicola TaxID=745819 RepID=A0ABS6JZF1_9BACI|nr:MULTISPECIES: rhodanese-like domain-containing protein [Bacillaceae]MBU9722592.1 rhodanese-like domain-containing protein [Bacillus alkalicola]